MPPPSYKLVYNPQLSIDTRWLFNIAMETGPFIEDVSWFTNEKWWFSIATLNNQTVYLQ